ncbi:uncharacterized protein LOC106088871 [Stomoxys calcitrans]|uniref:uncharacterized protein LOC106088871 n=1 Tax=Stomoxys calcitrans TaxID=35570 RepID=UPI0027E2753E|nr:uncharacterized protein LOC106088871 [Stomoxys calcitrans]
MDVQRLIDEVRVRPGLWDMQHPDNKSRTIIPKLWQEVADALKVDDVEQCKRKWKNVRDAYHALVKRTRKRIEKDIKRGVYDPQKDYDSKWIYYKSLEFVKDCKRKRHSMECRGDQATEQQEADEEEEDEEQIPTQDTSRIKIEPGFINIDEFQFNEDEEEYEKENAEYRAQFLTNTMSPDELLQNLPASTTIYSVSNGTGKKSPPAPPPITQPVKIRPIAAQSEQNVQFLENLHQEEEKLMKATQKDILQCSDHTADPDYNFLVSFMPQLKQMNALQNLQFRSRMCDLVLNIMAPNVGPPPLTASPALRIQPQPSPAALQNSGVRRNAEHITITTPAVLSSLMGRR